MTKRSPLASLLDAAFGENATNAAQILNAMKDRETTQKEVPSMPVVPSEPAQEKKVATKPRAAKVPPPEPPAAPQTKAYLPEPLPSPPPVAEPAVEPVVEAAAAPKEVKVDDPQESGYTSDGHTYHGDTSNRHTYHGDTYDGRRVERTTVGGSDVQPLDVQRSNVPPSDVPIAHGDTSHGQTYHRDTYEGETCQTKTELPVRVAPKKVSVEILGLSYNQAAIYEHLIAVANGTMGRISRRQIAESLRMSIPSIRDAITRLATRGFISDPLPIREANFQGFSYVLNTRLAERFTEAGGLELQNVRVVKLEGSNVPPSYVQPSDVSPLSDQRTTVERTTVGRSDVQPSDSQTSHGQPLHSSSSKDLELLTTKEPHTVGRSDVPPQADNFILTGPAAFFWEDEGLQEGQAKTWCQQFEIEPDQMRQQLAWAQFDLVHNGKEAEVKKDSISWFFGVLRRTGGCYPRPANYKTPAELRAEAVAKDLAADKEASKQIRAAELDAKFQQILGDPQSEEYKALFAQVKNEFAKKAGGRALTESLKEVFLDQQENVFGS